MLRESNTGLQIFKVLIFP